MVLSPRWKNKTIYTIESMEKEESPLHILIGGGWSAGKSTLAVRLAGVFNIFNIVHTDVVRAVLRSRGEGQSALYCSTYDAWKLYKDTFSINALRQGIHEQSSIVKPAVMMCLKEAEDFGKFTIVEGIHLLPSLYSELAKKKNVVFFSLSYPRRVFSMMVTNRCSSTYLHRDAAKYLESEKRSSILTLNDIITREAHEYDIPVFDVTDRAFFSTICNYIERNVGD